MKEKMRITVSRSGLATTVLMTSFIIKTMIVMISQKVVGELVAIPLWNATAGITANYTYVHSCDLTTDNDLLDVVKFTGDKVETCSVQLITSNGTAALIRISQPALVYAERLENTLDCQMKYISFGTVDKPCVFVSRHPKIQLFLQGDSDDSSTLFISNIPVNMSMPICLEDVGDLEQYSSRVSLTNHCQTDEFNHLISCHSNYTCTPLFPGNCNATLGEQNVKFRCSEGILYKSLIVYPTGIITLDLTEHSIINIHRNAFKYMKSLNELYLSANKLTSLPEGIFSNLPNLTTLYLDNNYLTVLPEGLFTGMKNLNRLRVDYNHITSLDENLFNETNELTYLSLWNNNLKHLPSKLFWNLIHLNELDLDDNDLTALPVELFMELTNLEYLYLSGNQIALLHENMFKETEHLTYLTLLNNNLQQLPNNVFRSLGKLTELDLDNNALTILPEGLFRRLGRLEVLYLSQTRINSVNENLFNETYALSFLEIRENNLTQLPNNIFRGLKNLDNLKLSKNQITSLPENLFNETRKLTYLSFFHNKLVQLSNYLFKGLSNLQVLDLDDNKLIDVSKELFRDLINLRYLYLSNNRFKALDFNLFQYTRKVSFLLLSDNELPNIPNISNLEQLFYLNVKGNTMTGITYDTFSSLPKETDLVVSQHEICECYVSDDVTCTAADDRSPFLTCDRLLSDRVLVVVMWLIGLNAIGGNIFVLSQRQKTIGKNKIQTFLLRNLAMADLLIGVYMLLIASADIYFGKYFPMRAETWRSGITCKIAGTISIVSSEASVFFVTLISIDRFVSIKYHNSSLQFKTKIICRSGKCTLDNSISTRNCSV